MTSRTSIKNERWTLQIEGEGNSVGADCNALSDTVEIIDSVPVVCQFIGGG